MKRSRALEGLLLVPLLVSVSPLARGFPKGHDWSFELVRIAEYRHALAAGQLPPAWAENLYAGYGSPIFLFYAPFYAAVASAAAGVLGSVPWGGVGALVCFSLLCTLAMRRAALLASGGSHEAARAAVAVYLLHPYLLCDLLLRNANAEFAALCAAPIALCGVFQLRETPRTAALWLAGGLALTILAHNLTGVGVAAMAVTAGSWLHRGAGGRRRWLWLGAGLALGLGLAAFFWLPAMALAHLVHTEVLVTGKYDFHRQFPPFASLVGYERFYGAGLLPPLLLLAGAGVAFKHRGETSLEQRTLRLILVGAVFLLLLMSPLSTPLWEHLPLLRYQQFPWRLQGPLALLTALATALVFARVSQGVQPRMRRLLELALLLLAVGNAAPHLLDARPLGHKEQAWLAKALGPAALRAGHNTATVLDEYLPRAASRHLPGARRPGPGGLIELPPGVRPEVLEERGSRIRLRVTTPAETDLVFARWSFPGWAARVDGEKHEIETDSRGVIHVGIPAGTSEVELLYQSPAIRNAGLALSGLTLLAWLGLALWPRDVE